MLFATDSLLYIKSHPTDPVAVVQGSTLGCTTGYSQEHLEATLAYTEIEPAPYSSCAASNRFQQVKMESNN